MLIAPLVVFLAVFMLWPLWIMISLAIRDDEVSEVLPRTAAALADWNGEGIPGSAAGQALADDLRGAERTRLGPAVRRLNSDISGFRTLMARTQRAADDVTDGAPIDLVAVDERWGETRYWRAIANAVQPYTDRYLLAAVDLERDPDGAIASMPEGASANAAIIVRTFTIAGTVTAICVMIGLPYAMLIAATGGWVRNALLLSVLLPLWTSLLVRTTAWVILLQNEGLVNAAITGLGLSDTPLSLIFNRTGVVIAMTHVLLPFMVLPIFSVVNAIPRNLMPAAASLGAPPLRAFYRVLLPLSMPGVLAGSLLVFMVAIGYYITPALVGGADDQMVASVIAFFALETANWGMAGALGLILLAATTILFIVYGRLSRSGAPIGA
ncbi:putative spermidine/putrescine transport system permease protein [Palleronia aestuarii]|uniref:Putative spermidine/putrescine transport system permease protein n=1 Tax=Palleronia aestuarii TaxID=568105 RepID=A0A2W7N8X0_9RHOB|nr:ABC transporter permease [Palleronia aestuarii]PZX16480.1 putative spermidine/putrescine transport system permease protein [Palleronia aestuarii]